LSKIRIILRDVAQQQDIDLASAHKKIEKKILSVRFILFKNVISDDNFDRIEFCDLMMNRIIRDIQF